MFCENKGQVWVETVIYTLIGLSVIAILLSMALPQIRKAQDRAVVEQTIEALEVIDEKIFQVEQSVGNVRVVDLSVSKGTFFIDSEDDSLRYVLDDTNLLLTELNQEIKRGDVLIKTFESGSKYRVVLTRPYPNLNLTFSNLEKTHVLNPGTNPYKLVIENKEVNSVGGRINIDFSVI